MARHPTTDPRRRALMALALTAPALPVQANLGHALPPELSGLLPRARLLGQGRLRYFGLHVYDARLWAEGPPGAEPLRQPLALEIEYARALVGARIAERSIEEMRRVGDVRPEQAERWLEALKRLLPDVRPGDRLTGVLRPGQGAQFFANGRALGAIDDAEFARLFFSVWLSPRTSEPGLRAQLLGAGAAR